MKFLTTIKINLEDQFKSNQYVPLKYYSKGRPKIKEVPASAIDKSYLYDCYVVVNAILQGQTLLHDSNRFINLTKNGLNKILSDKRRICAIHILEHCFGIIEVNHKYCFKGGSVSNYSKSYCIAPQYKGEHIHIGFDQRGHTSTIGDREWGAHLLYPYSTANNNHQGGCTSTNNLISKEEEQQHPIMCPPLPWEKVNQTTGRVFNHINTMKKADRENLKDSYGRALVEVDFCSSNVQHLIKIIRDDLKGATYVPTDGNSLIAEVVYLKGQLMSSDLYLDLANEFQEQGKVSINRDTMKKYVMYWLTGHYLNRKVVKWLCNKYPQITQYIAYNNVKYSKGTKIVVRKNFVKRVPKKNGMAIRLMRSESHLVNGLVMAKVPDDKMCYTVFDGFVVEQSYLGYLLAIINEEGKEYLGFDPKYKIKTIIKGQEELNTEIENHWNNCIGVTSEKQSIYDLLLC